jgi:VIT1/CCC1 family predicted Fe2+/Mn2+ transporter
MLELEQRAEQFDPHRSGSYLRDVILGGQDGLVNVLGVLLGVAAASSSPRLVLAAGLAATFAESISMAAVAYTSHLAEHDYYRSEVEREYRHIHHMPEREREEIRQIYAEKGFEGELLDRIVDTITSDPRVWVDVMMSEELKLSPTHRSQAARMALIVGLSAVIGSLIPLVPFIFMSVTRAVVTSIVLAGVILFAVGAYKARLTVGHWGRSGLQMAVIGIVSALAGYAVGLLFQAPTAG